MTGDVPPIVDLRDLDRADLPSAIDVLSRGMRDNPLHVAAFGDDPERRARSSYNGRLGFGVTGDFDTAPDVGVVTTAIEAGIAELRDLAAVRLREPGA